MIKDIAIENFRCFHKTELKGFERVNLFGGKNNVGKTSLLEALFVGLTGELETITALRTGQYNSSEKDEYLSFNQNIINPIIVKLKSKDNFFYSTEYSWSNKKVKVSRFGNDKIIDDDKYVHFWMENWASFILDKDKQFPLQLNLSKEFDNADRKGESDEILKAIQVIEPKIVEIKTYSDRPNILHLRLENQKQRMPISYFGDAIQKVMRYIITIANFHSQNGKTEENTPFGTSEGGKYLLIDEIENGLHYTVQEEFWEMIFKLAIAYKIQIFAATHSLEMIKSFAKVALRYENDAAYFEMFRHVKTDEITANRILPEALSYKLEHNRPLRGE